MTTTRISLIAAGIVITMGISAGEAPAENPNLNPCTAITPEQGTRLFAEAGRCYMDGL